MLPPYVVNFAYAGVVVSVVAVLFTMWIFYSKSRQPEDKGSVSQTAAAPKAASKTTQSVATSGPASGPGGAGLRQQGSGAVVGEVERADVGTAAKAAAVSATKAPAAKAAASAARAKTAAVASKPAQAVVPVVEPPSPPTALQTRAAEWKDLWLLRQCAVSRLVDRMPGPLERRAADELKRSIWHMLDDRPKYAATGCADGQARIFDLASGSMLVSVRHDVSSRQAIGAIILEPGPTMLTGTWDGRIHVWDEWPEKPARPEEFNRGEKLVGHENQIVGLAMSRDRNRIVSACSAGKVLIFRKHCPTVEVEVSDPEEIQKLKALLKIGDHSELYLLEDLVLGGKQLLWGDELLKEADFEGKQMRRELDKLSLPAKLRFRFAGCLSEGHPRSWRQMEHEDTILCVALCAEGKDEYIYSGSRDRTVRKWNLADASHVHTYTGHSSMVRCLAVNSRYLASGGDDRKVRIWRKDMPELIRTINAHEDFVHTMAFCPTFPERLVSAGYDGRVVLWDVANGEELLEYKHPSATTGSVVTALRLHESTLLTCCNDKQLRLFCTESGKLIRQMRHAGGSVTAVSLL